MFIRFLPASPKLPSPARIAASIRLAPAVPTAAHGLPISFADPSPTLAAISAIISVASPMTPPIMPATGPL